MAWYPSKVEIAFGAGVNSPAPVWTDVTNDVLGWNTKRGRNYELDAYEAGTANFLLDNSAGTYTPGRVTGANGNLIRGDVATAGYATGGYAPFAVTPNCIGSYVDTTVGAKSLMGATSDYAFRLTVTSDYAVQPQMTFAVGEGVYNYDYPETEGYTDPDVVGPITGINTITAKVRPNFTGSLSFGLDYGFRPRGDEYLSYGFGTGSVAVVANTTYTLTKTFDLGTDVAYVRPWLFLGTGYTVGSWALITDITLVSGASAGTPSDYGPSSGFQTGNPVRISVQKSDTSYETVYTGYIEDMSFGAGPDNDAIAIACVDAKSVLAARDLSDVTLVQNLVLKNQPDVYLPLTDAGTGTLSDPGVGKTITNASPLFNTSSATITRLKSAAGSNYALGVAGFEGGGTVFRGSASAGASAGYTINVPATSEGGRSNVPKTDGGANGQRDWVIGGWWKQDGSNPGWIQALWAGRSAYGASIMLRITTGGLVEAVAYNRNEVRIGTVSGGAQATSVTAVDDGNWHHIALRVEDLGGNTTEYGADGAWRHTIYIDGVPEDSVLVMKNSGVSGSSVTTNYTKTFWATWTGSYQADGDKRTTDDCYQGYYSNTNGNQRSLIGFNITGLPALGASVTLTSATLTTYWKHWGQGSGGTAVYGTHTNTSEPATYGVATGISSARETQSVGSDPITATKSLAVGVGNMGRDLYSGTAKGVLLGPGTTTGTQYYGYIEGSTSSSRRPKLEFKYKVTTTTSGTEPTYVAPTTGQDFGAWVNNDGKVNYAVKGYMSHWAVWIQNPPTDADIAEMAAITTDGLYAGELETTRLNRVLDLVEWAASARDISTTVANDDATLGSGGYSDPYGRVGALSLSGSAWDALSEAVTAVDGQLFVNRLGQVAYRTRRARYRLSPTFTPTVAELPEGDIQFGIDTGNLANTVTVTNEGGTASTRTDTDSVRRYGRRTRSESIAAYSDAFADLLAGWRLYLLAEPSVRIGAVRWDLSAASSPTLWDTFTALDLGTAMLRLDVLASNTTPESGSLDYFVESISFSCDPATKRLTVAMDLSPAAPYAKPFRVDDSLDAGRVLGI